jgi:hypothetical protein
MFGRILPAQERNCLMDSRQQFFVSVPLRGGFEKNQTTFAKPARTYPEAPKPKLTKVFCFFSSKKRIFLPHG